MIFYLVRHGQTDWNKEERLQGQADIPMNEFGISQMNELADKMAATGFKADRIISSPLCRARDSAGIISEKIEFSGDIVIDPDFTERNFGKLEGVIWYPGLDADNPEYGAEKVMELCDRAKRALSKYSFGADEKVMIVAHGAILTAVKLVLSEGMLEYHDSDVPIIQGNVLCCERTEGKEPNFYQMF